MTIGAPEGLSGAQLVARALKEAGVRWVFSLSGNQVLSLYESLDREGIRIVHTRHEGAAVHMADAWGRLTGEVGVCLVTAGPGHANALGALAMAGSGESPVLMLSGHAPLTGPGGETVAGAFQEMDQEGLARPVTRWSAVARRVEEVPGLVEEGLRRARSGRPGPVHLSLPVSVLEGMAEGEPNSKRADGRGAEEGIDEGTLRKIADRLREAERPLVVAGPSGARRWLHERLRAFREQTGVPVVVVDHPRGLVDPALGRAATLVKRADAVLLLGARQDYRLGFGKALAPECVVLQVDPDGEELGRYREAKVGIESELGPAMDGLLAAAREEGGGQWVSRAWQAEAEEALTAGHAVPEHELTRTEEGLHPWRVVGALAAALDAREAAGREACLVIDGGEFGQWGRARLAERLRRKGPRHLVNEPSGAIGYAVPFALAAKLARPQATVVAIAGDGAFGFYAPEIETAARLGLGLVVLVGNDGRWGTEYHLQRARYGEDRVVAMDMLPARYDRLAEALGGVGELVEREDTLGPALERALAAADAGRPAVVNARIRSAPSPAGAPP
jgi:acetolactate synthase-1/2/3 large subunit